MVVLNKIYTRSGDAGTTALASGARVPKDDLRIAAYGTIDETNAAIGLARSLLGEGAEEQRVAEMLARIQNDLFDLGADLATPMDNGPAAKPDEGQGEPKAQALRIVATQVARLEAEIDELNEALAPLRSFVLPGGSKAAAALHLARTICRRAERAMVALAAREAREGGVIGPEGLKYINRLSDFLFVAARYVNDKGARDVLWRPGENR